jgi:hypothetical protein
VAIRLAQFVAENLNTKLSFEPWICDDALQTGSALDISHGAALG